MEITDLDLSRLRSCLTSPTVSSSFQRRQRSLLGVTWICTCYMDHESVHSIYIVYTMYIHCIYIVYIYMYVYMYIYMYVYMSMSMSMSMYIYICICICNVCIHSLFNQLVRKKSVFIRSLSLVGDVQRPEMGPVFPVFHAEFSVLPQSCNFHREIDDKTNGLFFLVMGFPNFSMCQLLHFFHFSTGTIHLMVRYM